MQRRSLRRLNNRNLDARLNFVVLYVETECTEKEQILMPESSFPPDSGNTPSPYR